MLGFFKPRGELVEISDRTVVFLSAKPYRPDQRFEVKLGQPGEGSALLTVALRVLSCRQGPGTAFVVVGKAEGRHKPPTCKGYAVRSHPRAPHRITIKSEGLPGYRAVTKELGLGGFRAELEGEPTIGLRLKVRFEFEDPQGWVLDLAATIVWATWKSQNFYDVGFSFVDDPEYALPLEELAAWLDHRFRGDFVPFQPPDKPVPRPLKTLPNQLPSAGFGVRSDETREASGFGRDDDPTPIGLPVLLDPLPRSAPLKLPEPPSLPASIKLSSPAVLPAVGGGVAPLSHEEQKAEGGHGLRSSVSPIPSLSKDLPTGVGIDFRGHLKGWAWEGAEDSLTVVLEDDQGLDHWLEFVGCRDVRAVCLPTGMAVTMMRVSRDFVLSSGLGGLREEKLRWYRFYDAQEQSVLELLALSCQAQER